MGVDNDQHQGRGNVNNSCHQLLKRVCRERRYGKYYREVATDLCSTTGLPKGVELTHYNIIANAEQIVKKRILVGDSESGRARRARLELSGERWLAAVPMYHAFVSACICCCESYTKLTQITNRANPISV